MKSGFKFSDDNKRYYTWNYFLKHKFNGKVFKVSLNAGFTCPNIDGTKGYGGCTYCSSSGSGDFAGNPCMDIKTQFETVKAQMNKKWQGKCIAYFQAHTNTYAPVDVLKNTFEPVLDYEDVVGISIATRADCIDDSVLDYLDELSKKTFLIVELGLQSVFDKTGEKINRCHTYAEFVEAVARLRSRNINICVHIINGLPGEDKEMMLHTVRTISQLDIQFVKIHLLHVIENTVMAKQLKDGEFKLLERDEYVDIVCDQLELLPENIVIQRLTGDGDPKTLIGPMWSLKKLVVLNEIDKEMQRRETYQGSKFKRLK